MDQIEDILQTLILMNFKIAELENDRLKLERKLIELTGRGKFVEDTLTKKPVLENLSYIGQKTEEFGRYKCTITTDYSLSINKEEYEAVKRHIRPEFNPVAEKIQLSIIPKVLKDVKQYGSQEDNILIGRFIKETPKHKVQVGANA